MAQHGVRCQTNPGNGKMTPHLDTSEPLEGQVGFDFLDIDLARAIKWLRGDDQPRHCPGCQCQKCIPARALTRASVRVSTCECGWCPVCWAAGELTKGRL